MPKPRTFNPPMPPQSTRDLTRQLRHQQAREAATLVRAARDGSTLIEPKSVPPPRVQSALVAGSREHQTDVTRDEP